MDEFKVRSYTKKELALFYFPYASPHTAVNRLMRWINRNAPLLVGWKVWATARPPGGLRRAR